MRMKTTTSIVFTGDIGFDHYMAGKWQDKNLLDPEVLAFLKSGDHLCVNVEGALSAGEKKLKDNSVASLMHSMDPAVGDFLEEIGADIWNICNNHIMDAGPEGLADTLKAAGLHKALTVGAGMNIAEAMKPVIIPDAGGIAILGVGYQRACRKADENTPGCFSWSDMDAIKSSIALAKETNRYVVIVAHGGEEFTSLPSPYTRDRYLAYLDMGADVVVAHHPHVPMNYETVGDKMIIYSLGNFIFDTDYQRSQLNTEKGILVRLTFGGERVSLDSFGLEIDRESERIVKAELPRIYADVQPGEYELLKGLAARAFVENTKRQQRYLKPGKYDNATEADWHENFYEPMRSGRVPGECLDFQIICPLAETFENRDWEKSSLTDVRDYILEQIP